MYFQNAIFQNFFYNFMIFVYACSCAQAWNILQCMKNVYVTIHTILMKIFKKTKFVYAILFNQVNFKFMITLQELTVSCFVTLQARTHSVHWLKRNGHLKISDFLFATIRARIKHSQIGHLRVNFKKRVSNASAQFRYSPFFASCGKKQTNVQIYKK